MGLPARYFETDHSLDTVLDSISSAVEALYPVDAEPLPGYHGMDHYVGFRSRGIYGQLMLKQGPDRLHVVVFATPSVFQKARAAALLTAIVAAAPDAVTLAFPGGRGGHLSFG